MPKRRRRRPKLKECFEDIILDNFLRPLVFCCEENFTNYRYETTNDPSISELRKVMRARLMLFSISTDSCNMTNSHAVPLNGDTPLRYTSIECLKNESIVSLHCSNAAVAKVFYRTHSEHDRCVWDDCQTFKSLDQSIARTEAAPMPIIDYQA